MAVDFEQHIALLQADVFGERTGSTLAITTPPAFRPICSRSESVRFCSSRPGAHGRGFAPAHASGDPCRAVVRHDRGAVADLDGNFHRLAVT